MTHVAIIGGGPAGLMAAEVLARAGANVIVYDRMPSLGRKFLLAGRGGLNLTHSEELSRFMTRYGPAAPHLQAAIEALTPEMLCAWAHALGQETFVGSSGRVFPKAMKASPLLRAWLRRLAAEGVGVRLRHRWLGWSPDGQLVFDTPEGQIEVAAEATILALGGASWPNLGSDGSWVAPLIQAQVPVTPLAPANCGFHIAWSDIFRTRFAGQPLKRLALRCGAASARGEAMVTADGIEGGGIYALSAPLREAIARDGIATLELDLRPDETTEALALRLAPPRGKQSLSNVLRKALRLSPVEIALLQEVAIRDGRKLAAMAADEVAALVKSVPLRLSAPMPIARAISTAGGVSFAGLDENFMLRARPGVFAAGEMLDWEAPTGGYLLQASFATGAAAAQGALAWLATRRQTA